MRGVVVAVVACALAAIAVACVDVEGGDSGYYVSPCGSGFTDLLLCGRESGGADPRGTDGAGSSSGAAATCQDACEVIIACIGGDPADLAECASDCSSDSSVNQALLECVVANGCNYYDACAN